MGLRKTVVRGAVATSAAALPLLVPANPASAFEAYGRSSELDHTFTNSAGDEVTCTVLYASQLFREDGSTPFQANTTTQVVPIDPRCGGLVFVDTVYRDPQGVERRAGAVGGPESTTLHLEEVQGTYTSTHRVFFNDCVANCETSFTTSPK